MANQEGTWEEGKAGNQVRCDLPDEVIVVAADSHQANHGRLTGEKKEREREWALHSYIKNKQ